MNDTSVHNILSAISEAKLALDREPEYKAEIVVLKNDLSESQRHNQALEINCSNYRSAIDELQSKVRSLEVERDDASFRNMELEDKADKLAMLVASYGGNLESMAYDIKLALKKLSPLPELEVKPIEPLPSVEPVVINYDTATMSNQVVGDVSGPLPPSTTPSASTTGAMPASVSSAPEPSSVLDTSTELPYKGRKYSEVHTLVNLDDWIAGGGTNNDFWQ